MCIFHIVIKSQPSSSAVGNLSKNTANHIKQCKPSLLTTNKANLERNTKFETLGIDSLEVMEIVVAMEESFGLELSDE